MYCYILQFCLIKITKLCEIVVLDLIEWDSNRNPNKCMKKNLIGCDTISALWPAVEMLQWKKKKKKWSEVIKFHWLSLSFNYPQLAPANPQPLCS